MIAAVAFVQWLADVRPVRRHRAAGGALHASRRTQPLRTTLVAAGVVEVGHRCSPSCAGAPARHWLRGVRRRCRAWPPRRRCSGPTSATAAPLLTSLQERAARLERERDQQGRLAAAAERARIAREMHDIVAHNLSVMIALADGASYAVHDAPERAEARDATASRTGPPGARPRCGGCSACCARSRARGELAPQPGHRRARRSWSSRCAAPACRCSYEVAGRARAPLPRRPASSPSTGIVQEALTNTLKHAGPGASARVRAALRGRRRVELEVADTGTAAAPRRRPRARACAGCASAPRSTTASSRPGRAPAAAGASGPG